ncbi:MAG: RRXRR domain-containing protein [Nostoc sp. TH1S01]|nr:RRXRR domain-containing protein [Nostoc sp. TH1S01]
MTKVLILDADQQPLSPVRISHARALLSQGKAAVFQRYPFTIILKESFSQIQPEQLGFKLQLVATKAVEARRQQAGSRR